MILNWSQWNKMKAGVTWALSGSVSAALWISCNWYRDETPVACALQYSIPQLEEQEQLRRLTPWSRVRLLLWQRFWFFFFCKISQIIHNCENKAWRSRNIVESTRTEHPYLTIQATLRSNAKKQCVIFVVRYWGQAGVAFLAFTPETDVCVPSHTSN